MQGEGCREADNQAGAVREMEDISTDVQPAQAPGWTPGVDGVSPALLGHVSVQPT